MSKSLFLFLASSFSELWIVLLRTNVAINITWPVTNALAMLDVSSANTGLLIPPVALTIITSNTPVEARIATRPKETLKHINGSLVESSSEKIKK